MELNSRYKKTVVYEQRNVCSVQDPARQPSIPLSGYEAGRQPSEAGWGETWPQPVSLHSPLPSDMSGWGSVGSESCPLAILESQPPICVLSFTSLLAACKVLAWPGGLKECPPAVAAQHLAVLFVFQLLGRAGR